MNHKYIPEEREKIVSLYLNGTPVSQLAKESGIPRSTIYRWTKEPQDKKDGPNDFSPMNYYQLQRKYKKLENIIEILQKVNCKPTDPLDIKLSEMELLYGQYSVHTLCDAMCVPRGTFYNHIFRRKKTAKWYEIRREEFRERIQRIYDDSNQIFGPQKVCAVLQDQGHHTSIKYVRQLMKDMGLISIRNGAKGVYEREKPDYSNHVKRQFNPQQPNEIWASDVTYYRFKNKTYYICAILDLFSRRVIAHKIGYSNSTQLTKSTLKSAYESRCPNGDLIFHSDRGANYCSKTFCDYLQKLNIKQSFSMPHTPYDNAVMESFFSNLKREELYRTKYHSEHELISAVDSYMLFYNEKRPHHHNAYQTPVKREATFFQKLDGIFN